METYNWSWRDERACRDVPVDAFFPNNDHEMTPEAAAACGQCPVVNECLLFALRTRQDEGIWGGRTARQRRKMRRQTGWQSRGPQVAS